jgi:hypothetical protein
MVSGFKTLQKAQASYLKFFSKVEKKLRLTPLLFARFSRLFQLLKNPSEMIEKHSKGI